MKVNFMCQLDAQITGKIMSVRVFLEEIDIWVDKSKDHLRPWGGHHPIQRA